MKLEKPLFRLSACVNKGLSDFQWDAQLYGQDFQGGRSCWILCVSHAFISTVRTAQIS